MKTIMKLLLVALLIFSVSCRDTKKEEAETNAMLEEIESLETEVDSISASVDQKAKELEAALKELDSI